VAKAPTSFEEWYIKSSYQQFIQQEGAPMYEGSALENLATLPLADWERRGGQVGYTRLGGSERYNLQIVEIPPKGELKPEHHMYDAIMYVMKGRGGYNHMAGRGTQTYPRMGRRFASGHSSQRMASGI